MVKQKASSLLTVNELFGMAVKIEPKLLRLARKSGVSRATLYRIKEGKVTNGMTHDIYRKLAKFVLDAK